MKLKIIVIEDNENDFFRLREQIRQNTSYVEKIYACRFEAQFFKLSHWQTCNLIIVDNEIHGRPDAGLNFLKDFYKNYPQMDIYSILYTWGTNNYEAFHIDIQRLHNYNSKFLGTIFKQLGDYNKIVEIIDSIYYKTPFPIFDEEYADLSRQKLGQKQLDLIGKLHDLQHNIQKRLILLIHLIRLHIDKRAEVDFTKTLNKFSSYRDELPERYSIFKQELSELLRLVHQEDIFINSTEIDAIRQDIDYLENFIRLPNKKGLSNRHLNTIFDDFLKSTRNGATKSSHTNEYFPNNLNRTNYPVKNIIWNNRLEVFLDSYDDFCSILSRIIETGQLAINNAKQ